MHLGRTRFEVWVVAGDGLRRRLVRRRRLGGRLHRLALALDDLKAPRLQVWRDFEVEAQHD